MKTGLILAAALMLTTAPALAQATEPAPATESRAQQTTIRTVSVVDISELPAQSQAQVAQIEKQRTDKELTDLRKSIESSPALLDALRQKGVSAGDVVAASLSQEGALTIVIRKEG